MKNRVNKSITGVGWAALSDPVKREAGERPERSRRCDRGAVLPVSFLMGEKQ